MRDKSSGKLKNIEDWDKYAYYWDKIMPRYSRYRKLKNKHLRALLGRNKIIDSGAGSGNVTIELLKSGSRVYAVDISAEMLRILKKKCEEYSNKLIIKKTDSIKLSWAENNSFDGASSMIVLPYVDNAIVYLKEFYRILKKNGTLALSTNDPNYKNNFKKVFRIIEKTKGLDEKDLKKFVQQAKNNVYVRAKNWFTPEELKNILLNIGFRKISRPEHTSFKVSYFIKVKK